jgi:hypothetical protein
VLQYAGQTESAKIAAGGRSNPAETAATTAQARDTLEARKAFNAAKMDIVNPYSGDFNSFLRDNWGMEAGVAQPEQQWEYRTGPNGEQQRRLKQ